MNHNTLITAPLTLALLLPGHLIAADERQLVDMRDHLAALNEILASLADGHFDQAADIAEQRLGMSSMQAHGAGHMAPLMPQGMRDNGRQMHQAASRFARTAQEGESAAAYRALAEITSACVACHAAYRIR
jgi:hypothetical protein